MYRFVFLFGGLMTSLVATSPVHETTVEYHNVFATAKKAERPLYPDALEILPRQETPLSALNEEAFSHLWDARRRASPGLRDRLCYGKLSSDKKPSWQIVTYPRLPAFLNYPFVQKTVGLFLQTKALWGSLFPFSPNDTQPVSFDFSENSTETKTGKGALTEERVLNKQIIYPTSFSSAEKNDTLLLYNYAPLRTGGRHHFLVVPNPSEPAAHFGELDQEQYVNVLKTTQKVCAWAKATFGERTVIHFLDKTGRMAGQTQPLYHAHLIVAEREEEEVTGRLAMFFRMLIPPFPLSDRELRERVQGYQETMRPFLEDSTGNSLGN